MKKVQIILVNGTVVNLDMPDEFDFASWVRAVRADGYMLGPGLYIQMGAVAVIGMQMAEQTFEVKPPNAVLQ